MARNRGLTGASRAAAAISAGVLPAIVASFVLLVVDGDRTAALVTALIVWIGISAAMWVRFGRSGRS